MTVASVRKSLNIVGRSASIRELIRIQKQRPLHPDLTFPVSLRTFIGAVPPGRILRKVIPLVLLQSKFNEFLYDRFRPLFQLHIDGQNLGASTLSVLFDKPGKGYDLNDPLVETALGEPEPLTIPGIVFGTHRFRFSDVNSDRLTVNVVPGPPVGIEVVIHFESAGVEMVIDDFPNFDFNVFKIKIKLDFGSNPRAVDLVGWVDEIEATMKNVKTVFIGGFNSNTVIEVNFRRKVFKGVGLTMDSAKDDLRHQLIKQFINTAVSVDVTGLPDGVVGDRIESKLNTKIFEALTNKKNRNALKDRITPFLLGGDFQVLGLASDNQSLSIEYLVPLGQLEPFPESPQLPLEPGLLANIDHIVVLMMENRSFDQLLGYLSKDAGRDDVDGLRGGEKNHFKGQDFPSFPLTDTVFLEGPCHEHECVVNQVDGGKLDGFVADYAHHREKEGVDPGLVMGHYTSAQLPVYDFLAEHFLICQRWFSSHPGPTFPNRFYTLTGRLNRDATGRFEFDNPHGSDFTPAFTRTLFDHLTEHSVSWHYYENGYCFLRMFDRFTTDNELIVNATDPVKGFFANARSGTLPSVSFIDPDFIDVPPGNDDGPPADIADGQRLVAQIVEAVMNGPSWNKTLLVITYDEHGGFFDHVPPPTAIPVSAISECGVRVPTFVVSPWVDARAVSNKVFDHTSIAKTIARRFMSAHPPDMGERVTAANDLSMLLRSTLRTDKLSIRVPPAPVRKVFLATRAIQEMEDDQDFKGILHTIRARHPVSN
jgi:phospholipase C